MISLVLAWSIFSLSCLSFIFILYTKYTTLKMSKSVNINGAGDAVRQDDKPIANKTVALIRRKLSFILDNPYYTFIIQTLLDESVLSVWLDLVFSLFGILVHPLAFSFMLMMFIFFSKTTRNVLRSITTNGEQILIAVSLTLMTAYIYTILQFFYFYDIFQPGFFASNKPCLTMYSCYMNVINYGIRMGGGMGEVTSYVSESSSRFETAWLFNITFFFLINIIGLNIIFGIIIDTFGELRNREGLKNKLLEN